MKKGIMFTIQKVTDEKEVNSIMEALMKMTDKEVICKVDTFKGQKHAHIGIELDENSKVGDWNNIVKFIENAGYPGTEAIVL